MRIIDSPYRADDRCGWCGRRRDQGPRNPRHPWITESENDHRAEVDAASADARTLAARHGICLACGQPLDLHLPGDCEPSADAS